MIDKVRNLFLKEAAKLSEELNDPDLTSEEQQKVAEFMMYYIRKVNELDELEAHGKHRTLHTILENPQFLSVAGSLTGIIMILNYERFETITSRAFSMIKFR